MNYSIMNIFKKGLESTERTLGGFFGGILLPLILFMAVPDISVPIRYALPISIFLIVITLILSNGYYSIKISENILPKIIYGKEPNSNSDSSVLCILEPSKLFFHDMLVSFYHIDSRGFEESIGIGRVINIQEDLKIQVEMNYSYSRYQDIIIELTQNNAETIRKTIVKPYVPQNEIESFYFGER